MNPEFFIFWDGRSRRFFLKKKVKGSSGDADLFVCILPANLRAATAEAYRYAREHNGSLDTPDPNFPEDLSLIPAKRVVSKAELKRRALEEAAKERRAAAEASLKNGIFPFGKHRGSSFEDCPGEYLAWLVSKKSEFDKGSLLEFAADVIEKNFSRLLPVQETYAQGFRTEALASRITIKGRVTRVMSFNGGYGVTYWVFIKDEAGLCIVARGSWYAEKGAEVTITASIKAKETYKGLDQTIVNRVKGAK